MEEFRIKLINLFNESQLPLDAKYYVFKDVYRDVNEAYKSVLVQNTNNKKGEEEMTNE